MATLSGQTIANTFDSILHVEDDTAGLVATAVDSRVIQDGVGQSSALALATDSVRITSTNKLYFNDAGAEEIHSASDGHLEVNSGTTLDITAPTVDINASTAVTVDGSAITISKDTDAEFVASILVNQSDAADTTGIISQRFDLEDTGGNAVDSGKILVGKEASFTATGSTQDSYMALHTSLNGTLAEKMRIDSAGDVTFTGDLIMADGKGIDFAADASPSAGMTAEILDDYETGTWDAVVTDGSTPMTMQGSNDTGYYTKVGNLVTVSGYFATSSLNGLTSQSIRIEGLPFTIANAQAAYSGGAAGFASNLDLAAAGYSVTYYGGINTTFIGLAVWDGTTGASEMQAQEWTAIGVMMIGLSYRAA